MSFPYTAELDVEPHLRGVRIDTFLARRFRSYTTWRLMRLVRAGQVFVNGQPADPRHRVYPGQKISVRLLEPPDDLIPAEEIPFDVLFEDEWLLVVNKPARLIIHPTGETPTGSLVNAVQHYLDRTSPWPGLLKPGIVHRLDMDTSGVVAIAKDHVSHRELSIQFQRGRVAKAYLALIEGVLQRDRGVIDLPIGRAAGTALMSCQADALDPRPSVTAYEVVERLPAHTLVRAKPRTGRMHQIRVHFAAIGHPLLGDEFYAPFGVLRPPRKPPLPDGTPAEPPVSSYIGRQALHAEELGFTHPFTQEWLTITAPLPADMSGAIAAVRGAS
jgi:23S rRNA pseudouridine1911/1915/1917 synthase